MVRFNRSPSVRMRAWSNASGWASAKGTHAANAASSAPVGDPARPLTRNATLVVGFRGSR